MFEIVAHQPAFRAPVRTNLKHLKLFDVIITMKSLIFNRFLSKII